MTEFHGKSRDEQRPERMIERLESILQDDCRLERDEPILVGVSGGPDSLCLLSSLHEAGWQVIASHFNHQLRPEAADEAAAVEALAKRMGIEFVGGAGDVKQYATEQKLSLEAAARDLRYRFLFEQARRHKAQAVAVGHTADDQVETVLMHFIRGAGLRGLKGMPYRTVLKEYDGHLPLVRPLLDVWRAETVAYCQARRLEPHYDLSNESTEYLRNRIRHELIPILESYNPKFREAAWRAGKTLALDHEILSDWLEAAWQRVLVRQSDSYVELNLSNVGAQPRSVQMHIWQRAAQALLPACDSGFEDLARAAAFVGEAAQERADLIGGLFLLREGNALYLTGDESRLPRDQWPQMPDGIDAIPLSVPCDISLASGWRLLAAAGEAVPQPWKDIDPSEAWIDASQLHDSLSLRVRRDGDLFQPLGMEGHSQKLSDFFVNAKVPARARARWPLLCAGEDVIWVPGYRPGESVRVRADSQLVLHLKMLAPNSPSD